MGIVGLIVGTVALLLGMIFKGVSLANFNNPAAIFIIIVGTAGAVIIATPGNEISKLGKLFGVLFGPPKFTPKEEIIKTMTDLADKVRAEGILVLEQQAQNIKDPFVVRGIQLLTDGSDSHYIAEVMMAEVEAMESRHASGAQIFTQAGTYAPTLGVLGAVCGLIAAMGHMDDIELLGHAIAAAFMATLLGIFTGYVLWHPFANRLKRKSRQEVLVKQLVIEGILGLSNGENPHRLKDRLISFVAVSERAKLG
jgi:chemotaxis protein MotA